jgi:hypothetical protein
VHIPLISVDLHAAILHRAFVQLNIIRKAQYLYAGIRLQHKFIAAVPRIHGTLCLVGNEARDEVCDVHVFRVGHDYGVWAGLWARGTGEPPLVSFGLAFKVGEHPPGRVRGVVRGQGLQLHIGPVEHSTHHSENRFGYLVSMCTKHVVSTKYVEG